MMRCRLNSAVRQQQEAKTYEEWLAAQNQIEARQPQDAPEITRDGRNREVGVRPSNPFGARWCAARVGGRCSHAHAVPRLSLSRFLFCAVCVSLRPQFFAQLKQRQETYARLQAAGDEYGLMFHLRSELMRRQAGGHGYNRDGSTWLRKHAKARENIHRYQAAVCAALRYIGSGEAPTSSRPAQRLAFINETRHAFGRTALLLSGGAAFGVKHLGVVTCLNRERTRRAGLSAVPHAPTRSHPFSPAPTHSRPLPSAPTPRAHPPCPLAPTRSAALCSTGHVPGRPCDLHAQSCCHASSAARARGPSSPPRSVSRGRMSSASYSVIVRSSSSCATSNSLDYGGASRTRTSSRPPPTTSSHTAARTRRWPACSRGSSRRQSTRTPPPSNGT